MTSFPLVSFTDAQLTDINNPSDVFLDMDIVITRVFSYFNLCMWIFLIIYNVRYIIKHPESKPHNFAISLHLFFICTLYNVTFVLPLSITGNSYTSSFYFSLEFKSALNNFLCPLQGIILTACLLGMLSISLCISISCYFNLFNKSFSRNTELIMTSGSLICSFLLSLCCFLGNGGEDVMLVEPNLLCYPNNVVWRLIYDIVFCTVYIANLVVIVIIIVKLLKTNIEEAKNYIFKMVLLGIVLFTLMIYFCDLIHSLFRNAEILSTGESGENSNIQSFVFCLIRDFCGNCTGISLMFIYKPKFPKILCCKEKSEAYSDLHVDDATNELIEVK